jgi:hypothetical protein
VEEAVEVDCERSERDREVSAGKEMSGKSAKLPDLCKRAQPTRAPLWSRRKGRRLD